MIFQRFRKAWRSRDEILGMNARNLDYVYRLNPRALFPRADDKLRTCDLLLGAGIPVPRRLAVFATRRDLLRLEATVAGLEGFALKPAQGFGGKGILVLRRDPEGHLVARVRGGDERFDVERVREHVLAIMTGVYALEKLSDRAFLEELLEPEETLGGISYKGLPDLRIIVCEGAPVMGMLRAPTRQSAGRANLHQGALGIGIDLAAGRTTHAVLRGRPVEAHPDTGVRLGGIEIPRWGEVLDIAVRAAAATGLGYLGVDVVLDRCRGPLIIEVNARPGLTIQLANRRGLASTLRAGSVDPLAAGGEP
jgi:alpha-L-glutamate ligase-like protein